MKYTGNQVKKIVKNYIDNEYTYSTVNGIGNSDRFGINVRFFNLIFKAPVVAGITIFIPFECYYLKDLTQDMLYNTLDHLKFFLKDIKEKIPVDDLDSNEKTDLSNI